MAKKESFKYSEILENLPGIKIDIKEGEGREFFEFKKLSRNVFSAESEYRKLLQELGEQEKLKVMNVQHEQTLAALRKMKLDVEHQRKLSELRVKALPSEFDIIFQSLMSGLGKSAEPWMQGRQQEQQYQQYQTPFQPPQGQTPTWPWGAGEA